MCMAWLQRVGLSIEAKRLACGTFFRSVHRWHPVTARQSTVPIEQVPLRLVVGASGQGFALKTT
jgi:hypothetical protein